MRVFVCYILPLFEYGLVVWISGKYSSSAEKLVNATFTKFMKRYLNLPLFTNNSLIHHLTNSTPLMTLLKKLSQPRTRSVYLPSCLNGIQLTFFNNLPTEEEILDKPPWQDIPTYFWRSRMVWRLPSSKQFRRMLCREICDSSHYEHCKTTAFHATTEMDCKCKYCDEYLNAYHFDYKFCTALG